MKVLRGTPKHLAKTGQLTGLTYLMINLLFKCNSRCLKCFNRGKRLPVMTGKMISLTEILNKINEAKELGAKVVVLAGEGEPILDQNCDTITSHVNALEMIPIVYSNGSILTPSRAKFYHDQNVCLVVALDSLKPRTYRFLTETKGGRLSLVLKNLNNLRRIYADTVEESEEIRVVRLAINMTICSRNKTEIGSLKKLAGNDTYFICNPLAREGNALANWNRLVDSEADYAEHQRLARLHSESGGPLTLDKTGVCGYSNNGLAISPFGDYMTCAYTSRTNGLLGTIWDRSLQEAYELKHCAELRHYEKRGRVPCLVRDLNFEMFLKFFA